jgi:hypothetical protein
MECWYSRNRDRTRSISAGDAPSTIRVIGEILAAYVHRQYAVATSARFSFGSARFRSSATVRSFSA